MSVIYIAIFKLYYLLLLGIADSVLILSKPMNDYDDVVSELWYLYVSTLFLQIFHIILNTSIQDTMVQILVKLGIEMKARK